MATQTKLDEFTRAYIDAMLWSSTDESDESGGVPLDKNYSADDIADETLADIVRECNEFRENNARIFERACEFADDEQLGHDFWLTRNHHGAGFWDRDFLPTKLGEQLTKLAHSCGERWPYVGDDGKIYVSG